MNRVHVQPSGDQVSHDDAVECYPWHAGRDPVKNFSKSRVDKLLICRNLRHGLMI